MTLFVVIGHKGIVDEVETILGKHARAFKAREIYREWDCWQDADELLRELDAPANAYLDYRWISIERLSETELFVEIDTWYYWQLPKLIHHKFQSLDIVTAYTSQCDYEGTYWETNDKEYKYFCNFRISYIINGENKVFEGRTADELIQFVRNICGEPLLSLGSVDEYRKYLIKYVDSHPEIQFYLGEIDQEETNVSLEKWEFDTKHDWSDEWSERKVRIDMHVQCEARGNKTELDILQNAIERAGQSHKAVNGEMVIDIKQFLKLINAPAGSKIVATVALRDCQRKGDEKLIFTGDAKKLIFTGDAKCLYIDDIVKIVQQTLKSIKFYQIS